MIHRKPLISESARTLLPVSERHTRAFATELAVADADGQDTTVDSVSAAELAAEYERTRALAHDDGYWAGLRQGEDEGMARWEEAIQVVQSAARALDEAREGLQVRLENEAIQAAFAAVCRILGEPARLDDALPSMIEAAVKEVGVKSGYVIKVKPSAVQWLEKVLKVAQAEGQSRNWTIQSDATIELGGCLFESPEGNLDARLETQIEILRTALLENRGASGSGKPQP